MHGDRQGGTSLNPAFNWATGWLQISRIALQTGTRVGVSFRPEHLWGHVCFIRSMVSKNTKLDRWNDCSNGGSGSESSVRFVATPKVYHVETPCYADMAILSIVILRELESTPQRQTNEWCCGMVWRMKNYSSCSTWVFRT